MSAALLRSLSQKGTSCSGRIAQTHAPPCVLLRAQPPIRASYKQRKRHKAQPLRFNAQDAKTDEARLLGNLPGVETAPDAENGSAKEISTAKSTTGSKLTGHSSAMLSDRPPMMSTSSPSLAPASALATHSANLLPTPAQGADVPLAGGTPALDTGAESPASSTPLPSLHTPSSEARPPEEHAARKDDTDALLAEERLIQPFHLAIFAILLFGVTIFATLVINFTTDMGFIWSAIKVANKLTKSLAFRQSLALMVAIGFVRYGLEPLVKSVRNVFSQPGPWERSNEHFILQQVYRPLEFLLFVAAISTVVEAIIPPLMAISKDTVRQVVRTMLSLTYVIASSRVVFNIKARFVQERVWQAQLIGDATQQRRVEATDKLLSLLVLFVTSLLGLQAIGLDINSVLAISGFGGLALGLAGREILENLFNGLLIISNRSFDVGEEILFTQAGHAGRIIEGIVLDIGWYQTLVRSFEREIYVIPNSVFSRTVVLNVTRKGKEWRFFENIGVRVEDIDAVVNVVADMRRIIRQDARVLQKLHRRVFLDKMKREELTIYMSFYVEAANRDAFMAARQDLFLAFVASCRRHGAHLATNRHQVELTDDAGGSVTTIPEWCNLPPGIADDSTEETLKTYNPNNPFPKGASTS